MRYWLASIACVSFLLCCGCRSEGERLVDRLAGNLEETAAVLSGHDDPTEASRRALAHLESTAIEMRIVESRLDDVVRTLSDGQRRKLAAYARRKLEAVAAQMPRREE